jgi:hypothetical protein
MADWCVTVPFHRPELSGHVVDTILRQEYRPRWLLVVGNGGGADGLTPDDCRRVELGGIELIPVRCPIAHPSHARNQGMLKAVELGADWVCMIDSDDHYGPQFLSELVLASRPLRMVGKRPHYVVDNDGAFLVRHEVPTGISPWLGGAAQAFEIELAKQLEYPIIAMGEDVLFCLMAHRMGWEIWDTGPHNFVYERRGSGHQWRRNARSYMKRFCPLEPVELNLPWFIYPPPGPLGQHTGESPQ